jgi:hypothetical protein
MFKKNKKIKVTAYSPSTGLIDLFPIAKHKMPSYFKNLENFSFTNIKTCAGMIDLYANSLSIPAWQDIKIKIFPSGQIEAMSPQPEYSGVSHPLNSQAPSVWPNHVNVKLTSPWLIKCNYDLPWYMIPPVWEQKKPCEFATVPGALEFKYYNKTDINLLFPIPKDHAKEYYINAGDTVAMLVPGFTDDYNLECRYISVEETQKMLSSIWAFKPGNAYSRFRSFLRKHQ